MHLISTRKGNLICCNVFLFPSTSRSRKQDNTFSAPSNINFYSVYNKKLTKTIRKIMVVWQFLLLCRYPPNLYRSIIFVCRLFEEHSDFRDAFARFRGKQLMEITRDPALQAHGLRVLNIVDKLVSRLQKVETIQDFILSLGSRHCKYVPSMTMIPVSASTVSSYSYWSECLNK